MEAKPLFTGSLGIKGVAFVLRPDSAFEQVIAAICVNPQIADNYENAEELRSFAGVNDNASTKKNARIRPEVSATELAAGGDAASQDVHTP